MEIVKDHDHMSGKRNAGAVLTELEAFALGPVRYPNASNGVVQAEPVDALPAALPEWVPILDLITKAPPEPALLIGGTGEDGRRNALVHRGDKVILGAESKAGKTWYLIQKMLCIAAGIPFLGHRTTRGAVLYVNFELQPWAFAKRVRIVAEALGLLDGQGRWRGEAPEFWVWNLRGVPGGYDIDALVTVAEERIKRMGLELAAVALDPLYKSYAGRQENDAGDMAEVLAAIERFSHRLGAAVFIASHFAKGDSSGKAQIDRISGSGVIARDPDSILTLSKFQNADNCYTFEATLRNMASPEPVVLEFKFPVWVLRPDLAATGKGYSLEDLANLLPTAESAALSINSWFEASTNQGLCANKNRFAELVEQCRVKGLVKFKLGPRNAHLHYRPFDTSQRDSQ
jgi:AAA domain